MERVASTSHGIRESPLPRLPPNFNKFDRKFLVILFSHLCRHVAATFSLSLSPYLWGETDHPYPSPPPLRSLYLCTISNASDRFVTDLVLDHPSIFPRGFVAFISEASHFFLENSSVVVAGGIGRYLGITFTWSRYIYRIVSAVKYFSFAPVSMRRVSIGRLLSQKVSFISLH